MARGSNSRDGRSARSELPSGVEATSKDIRSFERQQSINAHGESYYGDNDLGVKGVKTDEELDKAGVKNPLVREFLKDPVAMEKIAKEFSKVELPERAGKYTDSTDDYAWNGERDVYLGSTPTNWVGSEWEIGSVESEIPTVVAEYKGNYFKIQAMGVLDVEGEELGTINLADYDDVGLAFENSNKKAFEEEKQFGIKLDA